MKLASIGSGSSGNCIYAGNDRHHFLIDAGISRKRICEGLSGFGVDPRIISGIFVTHEHMDHISGLGVFLRKYPTPVFATAKTIDAILASGALGKTDKGLFHSIPVDGRLHFDDVCIEASGIYHDAVDPVCYTFTDSDSKIGVATDFGTFDDYLVEKFQGCRSLLVESNHDLNMLMVGPYPYPLKQRILSNTGHLSNERAGQFLSKVVGKECRHIYLGHLSKENNYTDLAYEAVRVELLLHNIDLEEKGIRMVVASRTQPTVVWNQATE